MLAAVKLSSVIFYAVAAVFAVLLAIDFFIALLRPGRLRRGGDILFFIVCAIIMLIALAVGLFAVVNKYRTFDLSVLSVPGGKFPELLFYSAGKEVFSLPYLGKAVDIFTELDLSGIIIPFAVFLICLISVITVAAKTYGRGKEKKLLQAKLEESAESENIPEEEVPESANDSVDETEEELALPAADTSDGDAKSIIDEVDKLMSFGLDFEESSESQADEPSETLADEESDSTDNTEVEEETDEEEQSNISYEVSESEKSAEEEAEEERAEEVEENIEYEYGARAEREIDYDNLVEAEAEQMHENASRRLDSGAFADARVRTRVRTIVRRPAAKNITEIEKRAEEILDTSKSNSKQNKSAAKKSGTNSSKAATGVQSAKTRSTEENETTRKSVEAQSGGLPLTRKYIILNKHNAATVFNNYLNSKRESEKQELTGSLNTIIIK